MCGSGLRASCRPLLHTCPCSHTPTGCRHYSLVHGRISHQTISPVLLGSRLWNNSPYPELSIVHNNIELLGGCITPRQEPLHRRDGAAGRSSHPIWLLQPTQA
uniref:Uncharacterized protein n=1 Tax=Oryza brachyantha TaxID=4533 RepID=J3M7N1_ORYBR